MPFKSKAQQGFMFSAQARGDIPKGTAEKFAKHTKSFKALPEHKKMKKMYKGGMSYIPGDYERDKSPYSRMARGGIARQGLSDVPSDYEYKTSPLGYGHNPQGIGHMAEGGFAEVPHDAETEENPYEAGGEGHVICPACGHNFFHGGEVHEAPEGRHEKDMDEEEGSDLDFGRALVHGRRHTR